MKKKKLVDFINRYNLAKTEKVIYKVDNGNILVEAKPEVGGFRISVQAKNTNLQDGLFGVLETSTLKKMLGVLGDDITITYSANSTGEINSLHIKDDTKKDVKFVTTNINIIDAVDPVNSLPETYPIVMNITETFFNDFDKSLTALDSGVFVLSKFNLITHLKMMFGYNASANTDCITIPLGESLVNSPRLSECVGNFETEVFFDARNLIEILRANRDILDSGVIMICEDLLRVEFNNDDFKCQYLLIALGDN